MVRDLHRISLVCVCDSPLVGRVDELANKIAAMPFGEKVLYVNNVKKSDFDQVDRMSVPVYGSLFDQNLSSILKTSLSITGNPYVFIITEEKLGAIQIGSARVLTELIRAHSKRNDGRPAEGAAGSAFRAGVNAIYERKALTTALYAGE